MTYEHATGRILEANEATRDGVKVGKVTGLITTFTPERPFDSRNLPRRFEQNAFAETIKNHRERGNRPIRMMLEHVDLIGGFPIDSVSVNSEGLFGTGEINLETQLGQETFALAKQGILTDFSMAYTVTKEHEEGGNRIADSVDIFEASIVAEPANQGAKIASLESLTPRDLERALIATGRFTRATAHELASKLIDCELAEVEEEVEKEVDESSSDVIMSLIRELQDS
jgi:HK97 family phage prohead protease